VAALSAEIGFFTDRLTKVRKYSGPRLTVVEGEHAGKLVVLTVAGAGRKAAARGAGLLLEGHRPRWLISAGFAGALSPALRRSDLVLPSEVVAPEGQRFPVPMLGALPPLPRTTLGVRLLTSDRIIRTAQEKAELHRRFAADVVDMETSAVAQVCHERQVPFLALRAISDEAHADLPRELAALLTGSHSYRLGAALRAVWQRPATVKDLWTLHEYAQDAADRLAHALLAIIGQLD
jgi:adenosylhomocysteine nucleosidase